MKFSTKGRYALRLMLDIARNGAGRSTPLREVAERGNFTVKYIESIAAPLVRAGFLRGTRGKDGGYALVRPPEDYSVYDILRVMEGELVPVSCMERDAPVCPLSMECATLPVWQGVERVLREYLQSISLASLLKK